MHIKIRRFRSIYLVMLLVIITVGIGNNRLIGEEDITTGSSGTPDQQTDAERSLEETIAPKLEKLDKTTEFNQYIMSNGSPFIHLKADTKNAISFSAPDELKPTAHHLWWDEDALPENPEFIDGHIKIVYNPTICEVIAVVKGWMNAYIRVTGSNYVVIRVYKYGVLTNDQNATAFTITFKGK